MSNNLIPDYRESSSGGSMIRAACWLASEIGEGGLFTKEELRLAIPGVSQIDRRVRDLRKYGWVIEESRIGAGLDTAQQRLVKIGAKVWDAQERKLQNVSTISARVRDEVFFRDGHMCVRCGIAVGERFDDESTQTARLTAAHLYPDSLGGKATASDLVTSCQRCNESLQQQTNNYLDANQVLVKIKGLGKEQRRLLLRRIENNRREQDKVDQVLGEYRQLPGVEREVLLEHLRTLAE